MEKEEEKEMSLLEKLFSLKGKMALITGGYKGIGRVIAETYAAAGADVVVVARNLYGCQEAAREIESKYGVRATGKEMDVKNVRMIDAVLKEVVDEFGKIDILVNNAGIPGSEKPVMRMTDEDMAEVMNVDFYGTFLVSRTVAQVMVKHKSGKIINISSTLGKIAARNMAGYCASKAAVIQLTRVMALELIHDNIQVNVICPGYFATNFTRGFFDLDIGKDFIANKIPIKRPGHLDEMRSTALYLATCPSFLTGAEISIDGGHSIA
jgi:NAD(P)-dependent dehydrogenase (short-subunit alcohol dehydrogenase family)